MDLQIIKPIAVTDSILSSSTVPETAPAAYSAGTTYASGTQASVAGTAGAIDVYESLQNANTGHTPSSSPTWWVKLCTVYQAYNAGSTYALADRVQDSTGHKVYESLQASNTGHTPSSSPTWWVEVESTNRWLMFDKTIGTRTKNSGSIVVNLQPATVVNSVALIDVLAASVRIKMTDPVEGVVYDKTTQLVDSTGITDWYSYFFNSVDYATQHIVTSLPASGTPTLEITLAVGGGTAECGVCVIGNAKAIAPVLAGASVGITDYSRKDKDDWGNYKITERAYAKWANFNLIIPRNKVDSTHRLLAELRATPSVYYASDRYSATTIYGFPNDFDINIAYPDYSECSLKLEALV